ncbi:hypothetical protein D3C84_851010 [compost metagenome]
MRGDRTPLKLTALEKMDQRIHSCRSNIRILGKIFQGAEKSRRITTLSPTVKHVMLERIYTLFTHIRVPTQIIICIEERTITELADCCFVKRIAPDSQNLNNFTK